MFGKKRSLPPSQVKDGSWSKVTMDVRNILFMEIVVLSSSYIDIFQRWLKRKALQKIIFAIEQVILYLPNLMMFAL
jgi:hypothetical protein